jgi:hypothetical protein
LKLKKIRTESTLLLRSTPLPSNKAQKKVDKTNSPEYIQELRDKRKQLRWAVRKPKRKWMLNYAQKRANFNMSPKSTWDIFFEMCKGYQGHHKRKALKQFQDVEGNTGTSDAHNADIAVEYFTNIYNQDV